MAVRFLPAVVTLMFGGAPCVHADEKSEAPANAAQPEQAPAAEQPAPGILPVPKYTGDLSERAFLTGDWGGTRTKWAEKGVQLQLDWTNTLQSVVGGGRDHESAIGGSADLTLTIDLFRMGLVPGGLIKLRTESRYGESINANAGTILPVNTDGYFPLTSDLDDEIAITITDLTYFQFFSPKVGVFVGKIDTLDGDPNEFASGRGTRQFMNLNFVLPTTPVLTIPYSTLGGGLIANPTDWLSITSMVINTHDSSTTTGFDEIGDGWTWSTEFDFQYKLGRLPGGMNIGGTYGWDQDFLQLDGRFVFVPGQGIDVPTENDTWALYWSAWQYLYTEEEAKGKLNGMDGVPDLQGVGLFARAGTGDDATNPINYTFSLGVGGRGVIPSRDNDTFGAGYYYTSIDDNRLTGFLNVNDHSQGFEAFYNVAIKPSVHLTFDVQCVESASDEIDTATVLGARLNVSF